MKSLPRPWYLTKWRKPLSRLSRNDVGSEDFSGAWVLMEEDAEMRKLGHIRELLFLGKFNWNVEEEEEDRSGAMKVRERRRRIGDWRGREMVAAIAIALTSSSRLQVQVFSIAITPSSRLKRHCFFLFSRRNSAVVLTLLFRGSNVGQPKG